MKGNVPRTPNIGESQEQIGLTVYFLDLVARKEKGPVLVQGVIRVFEEFHSISYKHISSVIEH